MSNFCSFFIKYFFPKDSFVESMLAVTFSVPVSASSLLQVEEMEGLGGALFLRRGVQRCPSTLSNHAQSVGG